MLAPIRKIITQSTVDGPGNRVAVFLQGCNLRCAYCHNPETWHQPGPCEKGEWHWTSVDEVMREIEGTLPFVRGITVSGGECMLYPTFVEALFRVCHPLGLNCLIDTNGTIPFTAYPQLLEVTDGVMLDVKSWHPDAFHQLTGGDVEIVKDNLQILQKQNKLQEVRIVCIPGEVDVPATLRGIISITGRGPHNFLLRLIPFRPQGVTGRLSSHHSPNEKELLLYRDLWLSLTHGSPIQLA